MGKGKVRKKKKTQGTCSNVVYCGDGCHACMENEEGLNG